MPILVANRWPLVNTMEGGTDGAAISAANSGGASVGAFDSVNVGTGATLAYTTTDPLHQAVSMLVATGATSAQSWVQWSTALGGFLTEVYGGFLLKLSAAPPASSSLVNTLSGATARGRVQLHTTRQLRVLNGAGSAVGTVTTPLALNTTYWVAFRLPLTTSGAAEIRVYDAAGALIDSMNTGLQDFGGSADRIRYGCVASQANFPATRFDYIAATTQGWPDFPPTPGAPASTTVTATVSTAWDVGGSVETTTSTAWAVAQSVTATTSTTWDTSATATAPTSTTWDVAARVETTTSTGWNTAATVAASTATAWDVAGAVTSTTSTTWDVAGVATTVTAQTSTTWNVAATATSSTATGWDVRATVPAATVATGWDTAAVVTATTHTLWDLAQLAAAATATTWSTYASTATTAGTTWDVLLGVATDTATTWDVAAIVQAVTETRWDIEDAPHEFARSLTASTSGAALSATSSPGRLAPSTTAARLAASTATTGDP